MPLETQQAVGWAISQEGVLINGSVDNHMLVDTVRQYFTDNEIECAPMSYTDLEPYL